MHVAKKARKKAAKKAERGPQHFTIALDIRNGVVHPRDTDFERNMQIGDKASFTVTGADDVHIEFTSLEAFDEHGRRIPDDLLPFGMQTIRNPDPATDFKVTNSCEAMMKVSMILNGVRFDCPWNAKGDKEGNSICTSGGDHICH